MLIGSFQLCELFHHPSPCKLKAAPARSCRWDRPLLSKGAQGSASSPPFSCVGPTSLPLSPYGFPLPNTSLLPPLPLSLPPSPLPSHWSQPTLCHLRTPRDSRNGLNSVGRSPGIRHEVTSRPLSGLPALPSAGLLSACQTGSSVGPQVPLVGWGGP